MVKLLGFWDIKAQIKADNLDWLYLFAGEENFLKRTLEEEIKSNLIPPESVSFNLNIFFAGDTPLELIAESIKTESFFSGKRLIIVRNVEKLAAESEKILKLLSTPAKNVCVILETDKKLEDKFNKKLSLYAKPVLLARLQGVGLGKWITDYTKSCGGKMTQAAAALLQENVGDDLQSLSSSIDKLVSYVQDKKRSISDADVEVLVKKTTADTRFALLDAIVAKKSQRALTIASELSSDGKHATDIIGLINWQLKRIEAVKHCSVNGDSLQVIAKKLKISPYVLKLVSKQAVNFSRKELRRSFGILLESDLAIKKGLSSPQLTLETLIVRICNNL